MTHAVKIGIDLEGGSSEVRDVTDPDGSATSATIREREGAADAVVSIQVEGRPGQLLVAIAGHRALVGLDSPEGVFQFGRDDNQPTGFEPMSIGGQDTSVEARYVWPVRTAAEIAQAWITGDRPVVGGWQRQ